MADVLPAGWIDRVEVIFSGAALTLRCLGRSELLMSKVFALCDRGLDLQDCVALAPTAGELDEITGWLETQDANPDWPDTCARSCWICRAGLAMAYRRVATSPALAEGEELTAAMVGIGMIFAGKPAKQPNIEDTLLAASVEGMDRDDLRVLAVLVTWLGAHHPWINADRLIRAVQAHPSDRVRIFWTAVGRWLHKDRRLARLRELYQGPPIDLLRAGAAFQSARRGEDQRFGHGPLRVPAGVLRDRLTDILTPEAVAKQHGTYRCRVLMGPTYRADMWALLDRAPTLSASDLARQAYGSFATAWQVKHDRDLLEA